MNFSFAWRRAILFSAFSIFLAAVPAPQAGAQTAAAPARRPAAATPARPKLVVLLVVDQMRADYVDKFLFQWKGGLRRLVEQGAWFHDAAYPYAATETCVGHSTISTGSFPTTHGMIANAWFDRESQQQVTCTSDPKAKNSAYAGATAKGGDSAWRMVTKTSASNARPMASASTTAR